MSADGTKILVSDYQNFIELYSEDQSGNYVLANSFDIAADIPYANSSDVTMSDL